MLNCSLLAILTDETASAVTRIFDSDRGRTPYLNQTEKERHNSNT